jgi:hypothetical protein
VDVHPVWNDLLLGGVLALLGAGWLAVVRWASRGAEEWEALDDIEEPASPPGYP